MTTHDGAGKASAPAPATPAPVRRRGGLIWHADFRRLWVGDAVSQAGTEVSMLALPLVVVQTLHGTAFEVGVLTACQTAAFLLIGLPAGAWCDRVRRRPVMIAADVARVLLLGSVPLAAAAHLLTIAQMFAVALLAGVATVFFDVAYQSYLPELVSAGELVEGNAKLSATHELAHVAGPGLGGLLIQAFTAPVAILADAGSFAWSAGWVGAIRAREPEPVPPRQRHLGKEIGEGLRFVLGHPILRMIAGCTGTSNLFGGATMAVEVVFLVRAVHLQAGVIGLLLSAGAIGGVAGALVSGLVTRLAGQARTIWLSAFFFGPAGLLLPLTEPGWRLALAAASFFLMSLGAVVYNVAQVSFRQAVCPRPLLGRMNATMRFLVWGTIPLGGLLGGWLATVAGLRGALWIAAVGSLLAPLWVIFSPLRGMRDTPTAPAGTDTATT